MKLNEWMNSMWLPCTGGTEKYALCQRLNVEQAKDIMQYIANSVNFAIYTNGARRGARVIGTPYRDFLVSYVTLMLESGKEDVNGWRKALWSVLPDQDKREIRNVVPSKKFWGYT